MRLIKHRLSPLKPTEIIDYKNIDLLHSFLNRQGKIRPRRSTKLTLKQQRKLAKSVKQARFLNLLPFIVNNVVKAKLKKKYNKKKILKKKSNS
jgi:small subunit ribosomal protein S18|uniref:Small ribosomal subunit protein bS18c n=1 Tax=Vaucheria litorea TaxID=109269 RepID=B7T1Q8_VAULI|nr:ribosomal protein S18 [Vaucheria litorea]ACF70872.1 ribosomal protein S18 [Vaucheria litorea]